MTGLYSSSLPDLGRFVTRWLIPPLMWVISYQSNWSGRCRVQVGVIITHGRVLNCYGRSIILGPVDVRLVCYLLVV